MSKINLFTLNSIDKYLFLCYIDSIKNTVLFHFFLFGGFMGKYGTTASFWAKMDQVDKMSVTCTRKKRRKKRNRRRRRRDDGIRVWVNPDFATGKIPTTSIKPTRLMIFSTITTGNIEPMGLAKAKTFESGLRSRQPRDKGQKTPRTNRKSIRDMAI